MKFSENDFRKVRKKIRKIKKLEARKKLMSEDGKLYKWFEKFNKKLETLMGEEKTFTFLVENTVSIADFHFFCTLNSLTCGWLDGIHNPDDITIVVCKKLKD